MEWRFWIEMACRLIALRRGLYWTCLMQPVCCCKALAVHAHCLVRDCAWLCRLYRYSCSVNYQVHKCVDVWCHMCSVVSNVRHHVYGAMLGCPGFWQLYVIFWRSGASRRMTACCPPPLQFSVRGAVLYQHPFYADHL